MAVASMLALAVLAPAASPVLAETGNQTNVAWNASASNCTGGPDGTNFTPGPGEVVWVFVHTQQDGPGTLTANFSSAGQKTAQSYVQGGLKYAITTGQDTLLNFSDNLTGGQLTLSHTCYNTTTTTTTSSSSTTTTTSSSSTTTTTTTAVSGVTSRPSLPPSDMATPASSTSDSWRIVLIAIAALLASALVMTPVRSRSRR